MTHEEEASRPNLSGIRGPRLEYMRESLPEELEAMRADGTLGAYLDRCEETYRDLLRRMLDAGDPRSVASRVGLTEELKARDPAGYLRLAETAWLTASELAAGLVAEAAAV